MRARIAAGRRRPRGDRARAGGRGAEGRRARATRRSSAPPTRRRSTSRPRSRAQAGPLADAEARKQVVVQETAGRRARGRARGEAPRHAGPQAGRRGRLREAGPGRGRARRAHLDRRGARPARSSSRRRPRPSRSSRSAPPRRASPPQRGIADGEATKAKGEAEGASIRAKGLAEAEAIAKRAEALEKEADAVIGQQIAEQLPGDRRAPPPSPSSTSTTSRCSTAPRASRRSSPRSSGRPARRWRWPRPRSPASTRRRERGGPETQKPAESGEGPALRRDLVRVQRRAAVRARPGRGRDLVRVSSSRQCEQTSSGSASWPQGLWRRTTGGPHLGGAPAHHVTMPDRGPCRPRSGGTRSARAPAVEDALENARRRPASAGGWRGCCGRSRDYAGYPRTGARRRRTRAGSGTSSAPEDLHRPPDRARHG